VKYTLLDRMRDNSEAARGWLRQPRATRAEVVAVAVMALQPWWQHFWLAVIFSVVVCAPLLSWARRG